MLYSILNEIEKNILMRLYIFLYRNFLKDLAISEHRWN